MADVSASLSTLSTLFKVLYGKRTYAVFNTSTPLWSKIKKEFGAFKGKSLSIEAVLGFSGSVGSGSLPETNVFTDVNASLTRKKLYARILLDREAMIASKGEENAFEATTKRMVKKGVESFMRNLSRQLFAFENGMIFQTPGSSGTNAVIAGAVHTVYASSSTWVKSFVEVKDKLNVGTETGVLEVTSVNPTTREVVMTLLSGSVGSTIVNGAQTASKFYMQGSKDNDIQSILAVCKATSSTLYGVTVASRWQSAQIDAASAGITTDLINQLVTEVEFNAGESPDLLVTSFKQYRKIQNLLGDRIRYCTVSNRDPIFKKAAFNFQGIEWITNSGPVTIVPDRMCPDDHFFALNTDTIVFYSAEAPKWADEDGTVLLRSASADAYEARYICYGELFCHPASQGVLYSLA